MPAPARPLRARRRGALVGAAAAGMALAAHVSVGGRLPDVAGLALALGLAVLAGVLLGEVRRGAVRDTVSVLAAQGALHGLFLLFAPVPGTTPGPTPTGGHHGAATVVPAASAAPTGGHEHASMWLAHLVAALVTAVIIRRGDVLLARLAQVAGACRALVVRVGDRFLTPPAPLLRPTVPARPALGDGAPAPLPLGVVPRVRHLRGPPAAASAPTTA